MILGSQSSLRKGGEEGRPPPPMEIIRRQRGAAYARESRIRNSAESGLRRLVVDVTQWMACHDVTLSFLGRQHGFSPSSGRTLVYSEMKNGKAIRRRDTTVKA